MQQENICHTRFLVQDKVCSVVINDRSCTNIASTTMVKKLQLLIYKYEFPKKEDGEYKIIKQVLVAFRIGKYEDEVLYNVIPMQTTHLLLRRPWQDDR